MKKVLLLAIVVCSFAVPLVAGCSGGSDSSDTTKPIDPNAPKPKEAAKPMQATS